MGSSEAEMRGTLVDALSRQYVGSYIYDLCKWVNFLKYRKVAVRSRETLWK
jgi:hypothetical protein